MNALSTFTFWAQKNRWIWAAIGVLLLWLVLSVVTNRFSLSSLSGIVLSASFLTVVGIGQMFVVTTGRGNIDLSVASVITLSAFVALLTIKGQDANLAIGVAATVLLGLAVGLLNSLLVVGLGIPAIIATLATGYVLATATLLSNKAIPGFAVSPSPSSAWRRLPSFFATPCSASCCRRSARTARPPASPPSTTAG